MEIAMLVLTAIATVAALVAALPPLGIDIRIFGRSNMPLEGISHFRTRQAWVAMGIAIISLCVSSGAFYYFFRPRVVEKPVDRIVDRVVDKPVVVPCPEPKRASIPGIKVQSGAHVEGVTNAPNSMAAGINTGTMMQGDVAPQFSQSISQKNALIGGAYETTFAVQVTTNHTFVMQLKAKGTSMVDGFRVEKHVSPEVWGYSIQMTDVVFGPRSGTANVQNVTSGTYNVTIKTTAPDDVILETTN